MTQVMTPGCANRTVVVIRGEKTITLVYWRATVVFPGIPVYPVESY